MIPYSRPKRSDLYTLSQSKLLENHTLQSGTYLYSPYMVVPPPPRDECTIPGQKFSDKFPTAGTDEMTSDPQMPGGMGTLETDWAIWNWTMAKRQENGMCVQD